MNRPAPLRCALLILVAVGLLGAQSRPPAQGRNPNPTVYDRAFQLLQAGKFQEALTEIDAGLARTPDDPELQNLRGLAAGRLGRHADAEASFRNVIRLRPRSTMGYNNLGTLLAESGRLGEAADAFRTALKLEPRNATALLGLGTTLAASGKFAEAAPYLERAWRARPDDFQTGFEWALVLRELKNPAEARSVLDRLPPPTDPALAARYFALSAAIADAQGQRDAAMALYRKAYESNPRSYEIYLGLVRASLLAEPSPANLKLPSGPGDLSAEQHFTLGTLLASHEAYALAVPHFEATLRLEPGSYSTAYNLALAYKGAGQNAEAIELLQRTLAGKPTAEMANLLAALEESSGNYLVAVRHYQQAVELDPTGEQYYFDLGMEYLVHFTFEPAKEVFRVGTQKFPRAVRQYVGLGLAHYALRDYLDAAGAFLSALEIEPSSPVAYGAWNSLPAFLAPEEAERIMPRLKRLAETHPSSPEALYCYGVTLLRHGLASANLADVDLARSLLERALKLKADFADAHLELGNVFMARKEYENAAREFRATIALNPRSEMAHYRLGQTYRNLHQLDLARKELAEYTELTRNRRELVARSREAIKRFILAQSGDSESPRNVPRQAAP
ncbi:MAG: tetratricopeptide repeat protein [Acidobacteriia bacterium]|nr:tetratricopeptide repeat protein [Terriglobia bacterium]